jgi:hypothetical protein
MNKIFYSILGFALLLASCQDRQGEVAPLVDPTQYPVLTIEAVDAGKSTDVDDCGRTTFEYTCKLDRPISKDLVITATVVGGNGTSDDFETTGGVIAAYTTEANFTFTVIPDFLDEDTETLEIKIAPVDLGTMYLVSPNSTYVTTSITISDCVYCDWTLDMHDSYGDGWNGASVTFDIAGLQTSYTLDDGLEGQALFPVASGYGVTVTFVSGAWDSEITYEIHDASGNLVIEDGPTPTIGVVYEGLNTCP